MLKPDFIVHADAAQLAALRHFPLLGVAGSSLEHAVKDASAWPIGVTLSVSTTQHDLTVTKSQHTQHDLV